MNLNLENQYSPSLYTKRFQNFNKSNEKVVKHFISVSENATLLARQVCKTRLDVRYGGENDNQLLDIYFKDQEEGTPIFVYIHGGFWQDLNKSTSGPLVHTLIEHNYRIILVDYDTCPLVTLQQITEQICNFYKWLKHYATETKAPNISLCGHSAGAHLVLQLFKENFSAPLKLLNVINQVYLISGLYDLRELWSLNSCNPKNILHLDAEKAVELSPLCWVHNLDLLEEYKQKGIKIHVLVAENDSERFKQQSQEYYNVLKELKLDAVYKEFEVYDHFDIIEECAKRDSAISLYICQHLDLLK